jgi:hypothetical protein
MESIKNFFWFCSGSDTRILKRCPTDQNKYIGIGATVFFTGVLAFISSAYAIYTVFQSWIAAAGFGLIWGLMIFNLDRYIVSSMKSRGNFFRDLWVAIPRLVLAVLLAVVIAKPLELKIFETEINAELIAMEQEVFKKQEGLVKDRYINDIQSYKSEIEALKKEIDLSRAKRDELTLLALQEADGTGGSMQKNLGPIYKAKKADADLAGTELQDLMTINMARILEKEEVVSAMEREMRLDLSILDETKLTGFAARIDALNRLGNSSKAIFLANFFIMLLFIAIETAPIFVKLISYRSPYDYLLNKHG